MSCRIALLTAVCLFAVSPVRGEPAEYWLRWKNGDELAGQIVSATSDRIVWKSPGFAQQVTLQRSALDSITALSVEPPSVNRPKSEFCVMLADETTLFGRLESITPTHLVIDSRRMGLVTLDRDWIVRLQRNRPVNAIDLVDSRGTGWQSVDPRWAYKDPPLKDWDVSQPGKVAAQAAGARLYLPTELPERCDIELVLECPGQRPAFSLALGAILHLQNRTGNLEVETWGDELVISSPDADNQIAFEHLRHLSEGVRTVALRIFWDRQSGKVYVDNGAGEQLVEARMAIAGNIAIGGLLLENKGAKLTVTRLRVKPWTGTRGPELMDGTCRLRTRADTWHDGTLSGPDDEGRIIISGDDEPAHVAVDDVAEIQFNSPHAMAAAAEQNCRLTFADGTMLHGDLIKMEDGNGSLRSPASQAPITCRLEGLKLCTFNSPDDETQFASEHVLEYAGLKLRGTLAGARTWLGWRLAGAETTIPLDLNEPMTIRRTETAAEGPKFANANSDIVLLNSGDLLPCRVESIDEEAVSISTDFSKPARIPHDDIQAVSLAAAHMSPITGFQDRAWQFNGNQPGQLERRDDSIVFHDTASVSHPTMMAGGNLEFDVDWNREGQSYLMLTLTSLEAMQGGFGQGGAEQMGLAVQNQQMFYLIFNQHSVMTYVLEGQGLRVMNERQPVQSAEPVHISLRRADGGVMLSVDGVEQGALRVPHEQLAAMGVTFQTQPFRQANNRQRGGDLDMTISNLRAGRGDGLFSGLPIIKSAREQILTVPRMRRDRPPSHVLVGRNGDLLRGKLLALGPTSVQFESRLNDVTIARDRLSGIVWLQEPPADAQGDAPEGGNPPPMPSPDRSDERDDCVHVTLGSGVVMAFRPETVAEDELIARHPVLGDCRVKLASIAEMRTTKTPRRSPEAHAPSMLTEWTLIHAPEPVIPGANGGFGTYSELVGQPAKEFTLPLLAGGDFQLRAHRGRIVVLDFWATWCGPCVQAMPRLMSAVAAFPDDITFVAVNQEESPDVIKPFLESREWDLTVALDNRGEVGRQFRVQGIPQTVVIGRDGTIRHVHLGSSPDLETSLKEVLASLIDESPAASNDD